MPAVVFAAGGLAPFQVFISSTGTVVGAGAAGISLLSITGLRDLSSLRTGDAPRALADGSYPGLNYLDERVVTLKWDLTLASGLETALQVLAAGFQNVPDPSTICMTSGDFLRQVAGVGAVKPISSLQVQLPGRTSPLVIFGRPTKHIVPIDLNYQWGQTQPASEWTSADGAVYDSTVISAATSLPSPTSGMAWPAPFPWTFGSSAGGSIQLNNTGNYAAKPLFMIQGPVSYPKITHTNSGQTMYLNIVLGAGDTLILDHQAGTVTLNGTANRNNVVGFGSSFFTLSPGNNGIGFSSADSSAVAGTLTGYMLPTYSTV